MALAHMAWVDLQPSVLTLAVDRANTTRHTVKPAYVARIAQTLSQHYQSSLHIGIRHRARCPAADFVAHGRRVGRKFRLQRGNLRRVLRTQQIHGELVFGIQHPRAVLLAQRDGGNGAVELLFAQFRMKAAQRLRPKIS